MHFTHHFLGFGVCEVRCDVQVAPEHRTGPEIEVLKVIAADSTDLLEAGVTSAEATKAAREYLNGRQRLQMHGHFE